MKFRNPTRLLIIGLLSLASALVWSWLAHRIALPERVANLSSGFFMGLAIGTLLLSLSLRLRRSSSDLS